MSAELVLFSRLDCHLCERMEAELAELAAGLRFSLRVEDVDQRSDKRSTYGNDVPVLKTAAGREICRHVLDAGALRAVLAGG